MISTTVWLSRSPQVVAKIAEAIAISAGICPTDAPGFIVVQILGAFTATILFRWLVPTLPFEPKEAVLLDIHNMDDHST